MSHVFPALERAGMRGAFLLTVLNGYNRYCREYLGQLVDAILKVLI
jgi:hypothetical protein